MIIGHKLRSVLDTFFIANACEMARASVQSFNTAGLLGIIVLEDKKGDEMKSTFVVFYSKKVFSTSLLHVRSLLCWMRKNDDDRTCLRRRKAGLQHAPPLLPHTPRTVRGPPP